MTFFWILVVVLLISIALVLALWSMREYADLRGQARHSQVRGGWKRGKRPKDPVGDSSGPQGVTQVGRNGGGRAEDLKGVIILPKQQKVIK